MRRNVPPAGYRWRKFCHRGAENRSRLSRRQGLLGVRFTVATPFERRMSVDGPLSGEAAELRAAIMSVFPTVGVSRQIFYETYSVPLARVLYDFLYYLSLFLRSCTLYPYISRGEITSSSGFMYLVYVVRDFSRDFIRPVYTLALWHCYFCCENISPG